MKKVSILLVGFISVMFIATLMSYAGEAEKVRAEKEVTPVLNKLAETYKNKDASGVMALYAADATTTAIGADLGAGKLIGPQQIEAAYRRDFSAIDEIKSVRFKLISLSSWGNVAWLAADGFTTVVDDNETVDVAGKLTGVLKRTDGKWLFVQTHWSFPMGGPPKQTSDTSMPLGEKMERQMWADMKAQNMAAIEAKIAPGFQSVHQDGARDRQAEIELIKGLNLDDYRLSDFEVTQNGPVIVVTYTVVVPETIAGKRLEPTPAERLSVWLKTESGWQWITHANLIPLKD